MHTSIKLYNNITKKIESLELDHNFILNLPNGNTITDPFYAILCYSVTPAESDVTPLIQRYHDDFESFLDTQAIVRVIHPFEEYQMDQELTVEITDCFGNGLNGFTLPNGYEVDNVADALHFSFVRMI